MVGRLNHVAVAVADLSAAVALYRETLGAEVGQPLDLPEHGVTTVFVTLPNTTIELVHPLGENSPIQKFLDRNPSGGLHHICYEVADIRAAVKRLVADGLRVLSPEPKIGAHGNQVIFLHPKDMNGVLVELEEV
jgi:methylmalonyl-CoA/ethylmalonyl-CoA epimerase